MLGDKCRTTRNSSYLVRQPRNRKSDSECLQKIRLILRVYNMKIAEATNSFLLKSDPSSGFPLKYLEITVNQSVTAKSRAN